MCREQKIDSTEMNIDPQINFITEFSLSRNGMIKEIITEFNIVRLCLKEMDDLDEQYINMIDRILVMPLRKLLCESGSVLLNIKPDFRISPLTGKMDELDGKLKIIRPSLSVKPFDKWLLLSDWLTNDIALFERTIDDLPDIIPEDDFRCILNKLKKPEKQDFEPLFQCKGILYHGKESVIYERKSKTDENANAIIFGYLNQIGYNHLDVYTFLKHQSDKRGAHIDIGHSLLVEIIDRPIIKHLTITLCIALYMIHAAKIQIPELSDYWPELPKLEVVD